ncbi:MAG: EF-hand domain-containing protein [Methyloligellaceae bacterium]
MRKGTKIALAAGALILAGAAGLSSLATAEYRGSSGWGHHGKGHHSGMHHGKGHHFGMHHGKGAHRMMERFDTNKDGKLTQQELDDARKKLLAAHDGDKDGKLTLAEFEKLWLEVKRQRMVRSFQKIDRDGDASITLDEFLKPFANLVSRMDSNDDGVLDREDHRRHGREGMGKRDGMGPHGGSGGMGKRGG